jgi:hypothetical protein
VAIASPSWGDHITPGIELVATANDNVAVAGVQFKADNTVLGLEDTSAPYTVTWPNPGFGPDYISAVVRDTSATAARHSWFA